MQSGRKQGLARRVRLLERCLQDFHVLQDDRVGSERLDPWYIPGYVGGPAQHDAP